MSRVLISIVGPTAIGKTKLAISLAQHYQTVIISADSRQFYKEMSIGTAVPNKTELAAIKHHFIQHKSISESYSVGDFEKEAIRLLDTLFNHNEVVIMVGGSGLYVDAVTKGLNEFPSVDPQIREQLNLELQVQGLEKLQKKLQNLDEAYYKTVDLNNPHRLIRALEICIGTGKPYSSFLGKPKKERNFSTLTFGIQAEREWIYDNINRRVDIMMSEGLLEEIRSVLPYKDLNALQTVGYKELFKYLEGNWDLETAISEIKKNTRRFAKRQLTWFKRNEETIWLDGQSSPERKLENVAVAVQKLRNE
ncbi:MAG: tRNA dimethylallyltransferase [Maribacter sp.]|jgi:tRNA dimethylallyltransferase